MGDGQTDPEGPKSGKRSAWVILTAVLISVGGYVAYLRVEAGSWHEVFHNHRRRGEVLGNLLNIRDRALAYRERTQAAGSVGAEFPPSSPMTPSRLACDSGGEFDGEASDWQHPTWRALGFEIGREHRYRYQFISDGKSFTARATGDLDCDGVLSTFELVVRVEGGRVISPVGIYQKDPLE